MERLPADVAGPAAREQAANLPPEARQRYAGLVLGLLVAVCLGLPVVLSGTPQMDDYPAHLARYYVMSEIGRNPVLQQHYWIDWRWSGNLGVDLLMLPLSAWLGVARAGALVVAMIPVLTGWGLVAVEWSLRRRIGVGTLVAMIAVWSPALRMGFLNFTLALALALLVFALWLRLAPGRVRNLVLCAAGPVIWLCHMSAWGVLGLMVLGHTWACRRQLRAAVLATWPLWPPVALVLLTIRPATTLAGDPGLLWYKSSIVIQALRADWRPFDIVCVGLMIVAMREAHRRRLLDWRLMVPALLMLATGLAIPRHLGGGDFADARLIPVFLMLGSQAIDLELSLAGALAALAPLALRLAALTAVWQTQSHELDRLMPALDHVPRGARVASAVVRDADTWSYQVLTHVGAYATLRRDALVNSHFAIPGVHLLQLRRAGPAFADPSQIIGWHAGDYLDLSAYPPAAGADYLWYVGPPPPTVPPRVILPPGAVIVFATDRSLLARLPRRPGG